eukprot:GAFH01000433.1.p2 GENE.GAFH01000433.1~~GAFH01000433.1.p2  ORF type:complete len:405 (-),score=143.98 GAFH01000433.1:123-1196(-)
MAVDACVVGASIRDICTRTDEYIEAECAKVYRSAGAGAAHEGETIIKGIAFPTCISVNNVAAHFSPVDADEDRVLRDGDVCKIDLGSHIDGFVATGAHTVALGECTGRKADVILAAHKAAECAMKMLKPGAKSYDISLAIAKIAAAYHVTPLEGVLSHQMKQYIMDGNKVIMNRPTIEAHSEPCEIEENEVYCLDIVMSTGEGKAREAEQRANVFKRALEQNYNLKMKTARAVFTELNQRFPSLPFNVRSLRTPNPRMGLSEMISHGMLTMMPVLAERDGEIVAQFKMTCLVMASQTHRITGTALAAPAFTSQYTVTDPDVLRALATSTKKKKKSAAKKEEAAPAAAAAAAPKSESA